MKDQLSDEVQLSLSVHPEAGLTLVELLLTVGLLILASALLATSVSWISNLIRLPNPRPALAAIDVVRAIYNSRPGNGVSPSTVNGAACGLNIAVATSVGTYSVTSVIPSGSIACYQYSQSDNILRIYGHRTSNSCSAPAIAAVSAGTGGLDKCEYEEQRVVTQLYSAQ